MVPLVKIGIKSLPRMQGSWSDDNDRTPQAMGGCKVGWFIFCVTIHFFT
jgi:hypothetical protein